MLKSIQLVGLGGGAGSILRYLTYLLSHRFFGDKFPFGTIIVNIAGCLIVGILIGILGKLNPADVNMKMLLITGFCGGFTTFSALSAESFAMIESGNILTAILYIAGSVIIGLLAVWLGLVIVR